MSDKYTTLINYLELAAGGVLAFLTYAGKNLHKKFLQMIDRVEKLEKEQEKDALYIKQIEKDYTNKFDKLKELNELQFRQLHSDINDVKTSIRDIDDSIKELIRSNK